VSCALSHVGLQTEKINVQRPGIGAHNISDVLRDFSRRSSSLRSVKLEVVDIRILAELLSVLSELTFLEEVELVSNMFPRDFLDQNSVQALIIFLTNMPRTSVVLRSFVFPGGTHLPPLRVREFHTHGCSMGDPVSFARAVTVPCMEKIEIQRLGYDISNMTAFHEELANRLESVPMPVLEEVCIEFTVIYRSGEATSIRSSEAAQNRLIDSLGYCDNLRKLKLKLQPVQWTAFIDQALASCVRNNPHLSSLEVVKNTTQPKNEKGPFPVPTLYEAVRRNFVIRSIRLYDSPTRSRYRRLEEVAPGIDTTARLNREGRMYMLEDKMNRSKGIDLLGRVSDSLDCLYFHLRENPSLVVPSHQYDTKQCGKRKRDANNDA
jgi:hypothetical protein